MFLETYRQELEGAARGGGSFGSTMSTAKTLAKRTAAAIAPRRG
jgi:hypothetical protein